MDKMLKESSIEIYQSIIEQNPDALFVLSMDGTIIDVNHAFENLYRWKREEVVGKPLSVLPEHRLAEGKSIIERVKLGEVVREFEVDDIQKAGTSIKISLTFFPVRDADGKIVAISGIARDITKQKQLEKSLNESEKRYRLLANNSFDLIELVNLDGIVTYASPSYKQVLGYDQEEYVGKWVFYQPNGDFDECFKETFLNMAITQKSFTYEAVWKNKAGFDVLLDLKGTPMFDELGDYQYMMLVGSDITERKKFQEHLEYLSYHDSLTGIPNRRLFKERLEQTLKEANRYQRKLAIMYMDMDNFKQINDSLGHDVGDKLLKQFSNRVESHLRESDTFARLGGDEFTILLSEIREEQEAIIIAKRIFSSLQEPWQIGEHTFKTTSSIGIAFYPKDGITRHKLMTHADTALYEAKENGKNTIKMYSNLSGDSKTD